MLTWLQGNWGTILISTLLIGIVAAIVLHMVNAKKAGKTSCGCGGSCCGGCPGCGGHPHS